jgi:hypothetical protein
MSWLELSPLSHLRTSLQRLDAYYMPNWMCLMRAGIVSSTCFLAWLCDSAVAMVEGVFRKRCGSVVNVCYR